MAETSAHTVVDNSRDHRFELEDGGMTAFAEYHLKDRDLYIDYVFSPPELRGTGTAGRLMQGVIEIARERDYKVLPVCGYAVAWIKRHRL